MCACTVPHKIHPHESCMQQEEEKEEMQPYWATGEPHRAGVGSLQGGRGGGGKHSTRVPSRQCHWRGTLRRALGGGGDGTKGRCHCW